jgi:hypothetical protein
MASGTSLAPARQPRLIHHGDKSVQHISVRHTRCLAEPPLASWAASRIPDLDCEQSPRRVQRPAHPRCDDIQEDALGLSAVRTHLWGSDPGGVPCRGEHDEDPSCPVMESVLGILLVAAIVWAGLTAPPRAIGPSRSAASAQTVPHSSSIRPARRVRPLSRLPGHPPAAPARARFATTGPSAARPTKNKTR